MNRLTIKNNDGTYSQPTKTTFEQLFYRVAEYEDFMEEQGFESLEDLKSKLNKKFQIYDDEVRQGKVFNGVFFSYEQLMVMNEWTEFNTDYFKKYLDSQKENQALKDRLEELKKVKSQELADYLKSSNTIQDAQKEYIIEFKNAIDNIFWDNNDVDVIYKEINNEFRNILSKLKGKEE